MEHIFQIGINVDDDAIVAGVKANAEKEVIKLITAKVEECKELFDTVKTLI